ncbi:signal recognition particle, SRP9/SRP14 subunit [Irpex rosettiformis]|uniref:Signal recognition particle, SRP9/SRP14 subunit n=1 Tax=Irpex rosettiformis TaxID=378272 RepID=A0ACB8TQP8_9APHY|nr:signal recognition particle, SRP9/SRP14 subunit [Irpex rosettiformis]
MVYISSWQDFQEAAESLYEKSPNHARYCVKWRGSERKLVLKITDDTTCIKFKTYSSVFVNRFEALNLSLMQKMQNRRQAPAEVSPSAEVATLAQEISAVTPSVSTGGVSGGGTTKKKKPKKKK